MKKCSIFICLLKDNDSLLMLHEICWNIAFKDIRKQQQIIKNSNGVHTRRNLVIFFSFQITSLANFSVIK